MREIRFEYIIKNLPDGYIESVFVSLEEIESGKFQTLNGAFSKLIARRQYTGLKDKNGVEIYEGDMFYYPDHEDNVFVEYVDDMFHLKSTKYKNLSNGNFRLKTLHDRLEVIGNIYENQELLNNND